VVALLNSKLVHWYLHKVTVRAYQTAYMYVKKYIEQLPIKPVDSKSRKQHLYTSILDGVKTMCRLTSRSFVVSTPHERTSIQRQIATANQEIDQLVYELYGLTEAEMAKIEGALAPFVADTTAEA